MSSRIKNFIILTLAESSAMLVELKRRSGPAVKERLNLYVSAFLDGGLALASVAVFGYMLYHSLFTWYVAGPIMYGAGDRASEFVKGLRKIIEQ